jgi:hypothetical protein
MRGLASTSLERPPHTLRWCMNRGKGRVQIKRKGGHIVLDDRAAPYWMLGLFLFGGGVVAMAAPIGLATNAADLTGWKRLASFGLVSA